MWINLEEFFPPAKSLVALEFSTDDDYNRAWWVAMELEAHGGVSPKQRIIMVRREDVNRFTQAGLSFAELELEDEEERPLTEEERERERASLREIDTRYIQRLRGEE